MNVFDMNFKVITRDVDGRSTKSYKTFAAAAKRFYEMSGYSLEDAIAEMYCDQINAGRPAPAVETLSYIKQVSDYGTVVIFTQDVVETSVVEVETPVVEADVAPKQVTSGHRQPDLGEFSVAITPEMTASNLFEYYCEEVYGATSVAHGIHQLLSGASDAVRFVVANHPAQGRNPGIKAVAFVVTLSVSTDPFSDLPAVHYQAGCGGNYADLMDYVPMSTPLLETLLVSKVVALLYTKMDNWHRAIWRVNPA